MLDPNDPIVRAYQDNLGRAPDAAGYAWYSNQIQNNGVSIETISRNMARGAEAKGEQAAPTSGLMKIYTPPPVVPIQPTYEAPTMPVWQPESQSTPTDLSPVYGAINNASQGTQQAISSASQGTQQAIAGEGNTTRNAVDGMLNSQTNTLNSGMQAQGDATRNAVFDTGNQLSGFMGSGFDSVNSNMGDYAQQASQERANNMATTSGLMSASLENQNTLAQGQQSAANTLNTYYNDLATTQGTINANLGSFQNAFSDFNNMYTANNTAAVQSRSDMQTGMMNQTDRLRDEFGRSMGAVQQGQADISNSIDSAFGDVSGDFRAGQEGLLRAVGDVGRDIRTGQDGMSSGIMSEFGRGNNMMQAGQDRLMSAVGGMSNTMDSVNGTVRSSQNDVMRQQERYHAEMGTRVTRLRGVIDSAVANPQIETGLRRDFNEMGKAYDANGNFVPQSQDRDGSVTVRALGQGGNLDMRKYDSQGNIMGDHSINMDERTRQLSTLASASAQQSRGFAASPFQRTY